MEIYKINEILTRFRTLNSRANERLGAFDKGNLGLGSYVPGASPWERHNNGDELLYVLEGTVHLEILGPGESFRATLSEGSLVTVPQGRVASARR
jgi:mannose-6-phosphate isomerase-like protein (cupin superfamily)